jgi:hypothetical protein
MSQLAIAAVTAALRGFLSGAVDPAEVSTLPPDRAGQAGDSRRLNLFMYHVTHNAAWRNQEVPHRPRSGSQLRPPLALTLHYLLTAYGDNQPGEDDHSLLGKAMLWLHDNPVLKPRDVQAQLSSSELGDSRLERQFEPVRLTPETLSVDEMSKLWTTFQSQYRVSTTYQASVVLLESEDRRPLPLPVLMRGPDDRGVDVEPSMPARLEAIEYRDLRTQQSPMPAARLGDTITLTGRSLPGTKGKVVVRDPNRNATTANPNANVIARLTPEAGSNQDQLFVKLEEFAGPWSAGPLQVAVERERASGRPRVSAPLRLALAPFIHNESGLTGRLEFPAGGGRRLIIALRPPIRRRPDGSLPDSMMLLTPLGDGPTPRPIPAIQTPARSQQTSPRPTDDVVNELTFDVSAVPAGGYRVRLRVETVETLVMRRDGPTLSFDDLQTVRL